MTRPNGHVRYIMAATWLTLLAMTGGVAVAAPKDTAPIPSFMIVPLSWVRRHAGRKTHGMRLMPWTKFERSISGSPVISRSGSRLKSSRNMTVISRRARFPPRQ